MVVITVMLLEMMKIIKNYLEKVKILESHPLTNKSIFLKVGRYGRYLETETEEEEKLNAQVFQKIYQMRI